MVRDILKLFLAKNISTLLGLTAKFQRLELLLQVRAGQRLSSTLTQVRPGPVHHAGSCGSSCVPSTLAQCDSNSPSPARRRP